jgi:hypothetical protein
MKNLKQLLSEETVKQIIPTLRTLVIVAASVLAFLFVRAQFQQKDEQFAQQVQQIEQYRKDAQIASRYADSLNSIIVVKKEEARQAESRANVLGTQVSRLKKETSSLRGQADSLKQTITDSVELARRVIPLQDSIIAHQDSTIVKQDSQIVSLRYAGFKKDTTITLLTFSRDSLQTIVNNAPKPPKNPNKLFGLINLPSRKSVAIVSAVGGAIAALLVVK